MKVSTTDFRGINQSGKRKKDSSVRVPPGNHYDITIILSIEIFFSLLSVDDSKN